MHSCWITYTREQHLRTLLLPLCFPIFKFIKISSWWPLKQQRAWGWVVGSSGLSRYFADMTSNNFSWSFIFPVLTFSLYIYIFWGNRIYAHKIFLRVFFFHSSERFSLCEISTKYHYLVLYINSSLSFKEISCLFFWGVF